jgi:dihydrofolate reductase
VGIGSDPWTTLELAQIVAAPLIAIDVDAKRVARARAEGIDARVASLTIGERAILVRAMNVLRGQPELPDAHATLASALVDDGLLLGRHTYDIFASYWPQHEGPIGEPINKAHKYVATHRPLDTDWSGTAARLEGDVAEAIRKLKQGSGPELQVHGSRVLIQTLLEHDLVDELWLKIFPVTLGYGVKLFEGGTRPAAFQTIESFTTPSGVIFAQYRRAGDVRLATVGAGD